jgi:protein-S-isoprenylcysteine O-methyltransferase Ste14
MLDAEATHSNYSWKRDPLFWAYSILMFLPIIMVFAFYNYYSIDFPVYAGWILLVFSIVIILLAGGEFRKKGGAPKGKSVVHTTVLIDSGVYAVVRHPQYLGFMLFVLALVLMCQHWLSVISGVLGSALFYKGRPERRADEC